MTIKFSALNSTKTSTTNLEQVENISSTAVLHSAIIIDFNNSQKQGYINYRLDQQNRSGTTINNEDCICYNLSTEIDSWDHFEASNKTAYYNYKM